METIQTILLVVITITVLLLLRARHKVINQELDITSEGEKKPIYDEDVNRSWLSQNALELVYRTRNKAKELVEVTTPGIDDINELFK